MSPDSLIKEKNRNDVDEAFVLFTKETFLVGSCKRRAKYTSLERINCVRLLHCVEIGSLEARLQDRLEADLGRKRKIYLEGFHHSLKNTLWAIIISVLT